DIVDHADFDEANVGYVQRHRGTPAVLAEERVSVVDGERLEEVGVLPCLHVGVADDVSHAGLLGVQEISQLVPHLGVDPLLLRNLKTDSATPAETTGLLLVDGLEAPERLRPAAPCQGHS
ncbi:Os07g0669675, partial [Oryza sativa Japonica Group]